MPPHNWQKQLLCVRVAVMRLSDLVLELWPGAAEPHILIVVWKYSIRVLD